MGQASGRELTQTKSEKSGKTEEPDNTYGLVVWIDIPDDVLAEVLKWVPAKDIVTSCVYVCKQWNVVISTQSFWKAKCQKDIGYPTKLFHILIDEDFKMLYFKQPYFSNLIKNPDARDGKFIRIKKKIL